jgi:hypothetical protein
MITMNTREETPLFKGLLHSTTSINTTMISTTILNLIHLARRKIYIGSRKRYTPPK